MSADRLPSSRDSGINMQKSAEGIVVAAHSDEGPNMEGRRGTQNLEGRRRRTQEG